MAKSTEIKAPKEHKLLMAATSITEQLRRDLDITRDEYALCKYTHYRQADPRMIKAGWCTDEKDEVAYFVGISRQSLRPMLLRMEAKGLIEVFGAKGWFRATSKWIDLELAGKETLQKEFEEKKNARKETFHGHGKKLSTETDFGGKKLSEVYKLDIKKELEREINTPVSEKETFVTTFTPDQIEKEKLAVTVVEGETFTFDAADSETATPAGEIPEQPLTDTEREDLHGLEQQSRAEANAFYDSLKKEKPASQDAGTLKAECFSNNPPPIFLNPELQRRYNGTAPTNGKARKSPAENRTAQICAEIKTPEVLDFFHAIRDAWSEWTDYKRREKKGAYKTAKTEAATIMALARTVNYDPEAGRAAIGYSIAHTYQGIYPSKDAKPTAGPCARYSMQDGPRATTPEEMTMEISKFYNANKDKYQSLLRHPGMERYTVPKLKEAVSLFCASRIKQNRGSESFQQQHAALEQHFLYLIKREREEGAKQGGQTYNPADLRAAEKRGR